MTASSYYIITIGVAAAFFLVVWGVSDDYNVETPWITAAISSSMLIVGAIVLREVIIRSARRKALHRQTIPAGSPRRDDVNGKLTIALNTRILKEIKKRSDAANVLRKVPEAHREVFELCGEYLLRVEQELKVISPASLRLEPILSGRRKASKMHRFHMLRWAEIEATQLTFRAQSDEDPKVRLAAADNALSTVQTALQIYPEERALEESRALLDDMVVSMNVSQCVSDAEQAVSQGGYARARGLYRDALLYLGRDNISTTARTEAACRINAAIEKIRHYEQDRR